MNYWRERLSYDEALRFTDHNIRSAPPGARELTSFRLSDRPPTETRIEGLPRSSTQSVESSGNNTMLSLSALRLLQEQRAGHLTRGGYQDDLHSVRTNCISVGLSENVYSSGARQAPVSLTREEADRRLAAELSRPLSASSVENPSRIDRFDSRVVPTTRSLPGVDRGLSDDYLRGTHRFGDNMHLPDRQLDTLLLSLRQRSSLLAAERSAEEYRRLSRRCLQNIVGDGLSLLHHLPGATAVPAASRRCEDDSPLLAIGPRNASGLKRSNQLESSKTKRIRAEDRWTTVPSASIKTVPNQGKGQVIPMSNRDDRSILTPYQALIRESLEYFTATEDDVTTKIQGRRKPVVSNQLGIRCKHCSHLPVSARNRAAVYYPRTLPNLYQGAQHIAGVHFPICAKFPKELLDVLAEERPRKVFSKAGRPYWAEMCDTVGIYEEDHALWLLPNQGHFVHGSSL